MQPRISLYSSVLERQSCKLKVLDSIPSGGWAFASVSHGGGHGCSQLPTLAPWRWPSLFTAAIIGPAIQKVGLEVIEAYLKLLVILGPEKASYSGLLIPFFAILMSTIFEDYQWTLMAATGFVLVAAGNYLVMGRR